MRLISIPIGAWCLAAFVILGLPAPASASFRPVYGGGAKLGADGHIATHDPARATTDAERLLARAAHCTIADIVSSVEKADETRVLIRLLENLVFHDGTRLQASDVERSLRRVAAMRPASPFAWRLLAIAQRDTGNELELGITVKSPTMLEIDLVSSDMDIIEWLDDPGLAIVKADGLTGCGPFMRSRIEGERPPRLLESGGPSLSALSLTPFERHPGGRPFLDNLRIVPLGSAPRPGDELDGAEGLLSRRTTSTVVHDRQLIFIRIAGSGDIDPTLRHKISSSLDREAMARLFMGPGARPIESFALLAASMGKQEPSTPRQDSTSPTGSEPEGMIIGYDRASPTQRRLAERIQLRLHDDGIHARLSALQDLDHPPREGEPRLLLDVLDDLPTCPVKRIVSIAHHVGGPEVARPALMSLLESSEPEHRVTLTTSLEVDLGLITLASQPRHSWLSKSLHPSTICKAKGLDPAAIWRLPDELGQAIPAPRGGY